MPTVKEGMAWFKQNFASQIRQDTPGTPFTVDMMTAIAVQETFEVWGRRLQDHAGR